MDEDDIDMIIPVCENQSCRLNKHSAPAGIHYFTVIASETKGSYATKNVEIKQIVFRNKQKTWSRRYCEDCAKQIEQEFNNDGNY